MRLLAVMVWLLAAASLSLAQTPKRILFFSHTAGFRHGSINAARDVLRGLDPARFAITASEDLSILTAERLKNFDAVFFYTSGELALSAEQKRDFLEFVRGGGGFAGTHSATDTLYSWPEYGELIGGYFDGHPWTQNVRIDVEDPEHPVTRGLPQSFALREEVYQFRAFDRRKTRVLLTLDTRTVNLRANGVNRSDGDFALAWVHRYGQGRVFYTALGHFDEVFRDAHVQRMLRQGLEWITGLSDGDATPRGGEAVPEVTSMTEAAQFTQQGLIAPGSWVTLFGRGLTSGSTWTAGLGTVRLVGTSVLLNGEPLQLIYAAPGQLNVLMPGAMPAQPVLTVRAGVVDSVGREARAVAVTPGIFAVTFSPGAATLWCTGLGEVDAAGNTRLRPSVTYNGVVSEVLYSGLAPGFAGLYQVNVRRPETGQLSTMIRLEVGGAAAVVRLP